MDPRVLVVDDSDVFRRLVREALLGEGWIVDEAETAEQGLSLARRLPYAAILLDFVLPDADGLVALDAFRRWGVDTPVVVLSGSESPEVATSFLLAGAVEYLRKDRITPLRIVHCVRQAMRVGEARAKMRAAHPPREHTIPIAPEEAPDTLDAPGGEGARVLLVDDTDDARYLLRRILERHGWIVEEAGSGADALRHAAAREPDVIVLDYLLPDMGGVDLLRQLRASGIRAPVVALTGHGNERVAQEFMMAGAADFLSKDDLPEHRLLLSLRNALWLRQVPVAKS